MNILLNSAHQYKKSIRITILKIPILENFHIIWYNQLSKLDNKFPKFSDKNDQRFTSLCLWRKYVNKVRRHDDDDDYEVTVLFCILTMLQFKIYIGHNKKMIEFKHIFQSRWLPKFTSSPFYEGLKSWLELGVISWPCTAKSPQ